MAIDAQTAYQSVGAELAPASVRMTKMFGMPCLRAGGKAFAGLHGDAMVFKLRGPAHAEALALPGSQRFDPMGNGRTMKEWIEVPSAHAARWPALAREALGYVAGLR